MYLFRSFGPFPTFSQPEHNLDLLVFDVVRRSFGEVDGLYFFPKVSVRFR